MTELTDSLAQFHFLRPLWLLALPLLIILILAVRHRHQRGGAWQRVIHPRLLTLLVTGPQQPRTLPIRAMLLAALLTTLALAGPSWERTPVASSRLDSALVILFDLSPSMLATDVRPDRLTRARLKTIDILNRHREGSVALVAWAGDAHVVTPLTDDANTLLTLLPVLNPEIMPSAGSSPELALEKGLELLLNAGHQTGDLLFVTDGFVEQAVENIQHSLRGFPHIRLSILGIGSDDGAPIPLGEGGFARDSRGGIVVAQLGSTLLQRLAERNGGRYSTLTADDADLDYVLQPILDQASGEIREQERSVDTWLDRGSWLVLALVPLAVLAFRRNLLALLLVVPLMTNPGTARADDATTGWTDLWRNRDLQGYRALQNHEPERASKLFRDSRWRAIADYRRGDYAAAAEGFANDASADGHYNLGNALARQGRLEEALAAYDQALALDPALENARHNRQLVEKLLNEDQPPGENSESSSPDTEDSDSGEQGENASPKDPSPGEKSAQGPQDGDSGEDQSRDDGTGQPAPNDAESAEQDGDGSDAQSASDSPQEDAGDRSRDTDSARDTDSPQGSDTTQDSDSPQTADNPRRTDSPQRTDTPEDTAAEQESRNNAGAAESAEGEDGAAVEDDAAVPPDTELDYWLRRVPDDPGGLLRRKFEHQSRQQALEPRQRFNLPPDRFQEERW